MGKTALIIILTTVILGLGYTLFFRASHQSNEQVISAVKQKVPVVMYANDTCPYCVQAKAFFDKKGLEYQVRNINTGKNAQEMLARTGQKTIPQIFINRQHIGGFTDLMNLESAGTLNQMLQGL